MSLARERGTAGSALLAKKRRPPVSNSLDMHSKCTLGLDARAAYGERQVIRRALREREAVLLEVGEDVLVRLLRRPKSLGNLPLAKEVAKLGRARVVYLLEIAVEPGLIGALQDDCQRDRFGLRARQRGHWRRSLESRQHMTGQPHHLSERTGL